MRVQPTEIEKLNAEHPGVQLDVDTLLNRGSLLQDVQSMLREKHGVNVSHQTLSKYKQKRWLPSVQRIQDRVERSQAIIRAIKSEGDNDFARAFIFEQLDEAAARGERIDPAVLLREQRLRTELQLRFQQLEQTNRKLELGIVAMARRFDDATRESAKKYGNLSIEDLNAIRDRCFGLPALDTRTGEPPKPFDPNMALRKISEIIGTGQGMETREEKESA